MTAGGTTVTLPGAFSVTNERAVADAVDAPGLTWSSSTNAEWLVNSPVTLDGVDAARSGRIGHSAVSVLSTTVNGPATVSFWWRVSCENIHDRLQFSVDLGAPW